MDEENVFPIPNLKLQQQLFLLVDDSSVSVDRQKARKNAGAELLKGIEEDEMAPYYAALLADPVISKLLPSPVASTSLNHALSSSDLLSNLQAKNRAELERLDGVQKRAEENEGDMEINAVLKDRANYYAKIGDKENAVSAHKLAIEKASGLGSKIDLTLGLIRIGLFFGDTSLVISSIASAKKFVEEGGDWDRRNRLKVYEGLHLLSIRDFHKGGELFLEALSTFTATELLEYNDFIALTVIANTFALKRVDLKKKIIESPEVLQVIDELPHLRQYINSLYSCQYGAFFKALAEVEQAYILPSRTLNPHARFYVKEMRIIAYAQLLESYRSVTLGSMADAFGVSVNFIDSELSRFISSGRLPAVIDKVHGIIETRRPDSKNAQYSKIIKDGDVLLNSLQKLSRTAL
ncbi:putative RPN7-subunit of the regulatory particle of the proteasome [Tilletiaria anomala UBC 951]|uniref:Putative RPN7-subunit of the regulatory particle of the proteasome n=1 Tax=Tilletiaria anomala (strain ATCC 24038 / CBS 436.72 / UBC 951) TaxID=1037660 RepID=A0A066VNL9_TILAU|nr:putative RPN7-subunit of the regulatory particle of the proteasome [Tilletiaria anomala UBC 951]KDN41868.1 putative RPN7-subunit of the regulatory particle of the proteasome [Tilletiaria anomala UBC 951]